MALDLSKDHLIIDDPVSISYRVKTGHTAFGPTLTIPYCQIEEIKKTLIEPDLRVIETFVTIFKTPAVSAGLTTSPARHDLVTLDGRELVVVEVEEQDRDQSHVPQRWRLFCRQSFP